MLESFLACDDAVTVLEEVAQESGFLEGKGDAAAVLAGFRGVEIDVDIAEANASEAGVFLFGNAPCDRFDSGEEFAGVAGARDGIVCSETESTHALVSEHDERSIDAAAAEFGAELEMHVEENQVESSRDGDPEGRGWVPRDFDFKVLGDENGKQAVDLGLLHCDEKNSHPD